MPQYPVDIEDVYLPKDVIERGWRLGAVHVPGLSAHPALDKRYVLVCATHDTYPFDFVKIEPHNHAATPQYSVRTKKPEGIVMGENGVCVTGTKVETAWCYWAQTAGPLEIDQVRSIRL